MGIDAPRESLNKGLIEENISDYWRVRVLHHTESTQIDLANQKNLITGEVVAAEYQSKGRGRLDRTFEAPQSSALLFSLFYKPNRPTKEWSYLTLLVGVSIINALKEVDINSAATIKWPNDILINEKKVAGTIAQVHKDGVIIGIGINVDMSLEELPVPTATSLKLNGFETLDRNLILAKVLSTLESNLQEWELGKDFLSEYESLSSTINREVKADFIDGSSEISKAIGVNSFGELLLESGRFVGVADISHLR